MYSLVDNVERGKMPFRNKFDTKHVKKKKKKPSACCQKLVKSVQNCYLKLRALVLVLNSLGGIIAFYMTIHFFLRPGIIILSADLKPAKCKVAYINHLEGRKNCTWTSCKMGCTRPEIYKCLHVLVFTENIENISDYEKNNWTSDFSVEETKLRLALQNKSVIEMINRNKFDFLPHLRLEYSIGLSRLLVSVTGCGYTSCKEWQDQFAQIGKTFVCFRSTDMILSVPFYTFWDAVLKIFLGLFPIILSVVSMFLMYYIYCRKGSTDNTLTLEINPEILKEKQEKAKIELLQKLHKQQNSSEKLDLKILLGVMGKENQVSPLSPNSPSFEGLHVLETATTSSSVYSIESSMSRRVRVIERWKTAVNKIRKEKENSRSSSPEHEFTEINIAY
ncbi:UNVERIFIED_CONTAM: hypothetical protein RMT77_002195 [Armadillidium vulgare]